MATDLMALLHAIPMARLQLGGLSPLDPAVRDARARLEELELGQAGAAVDARNRQARTHDQEYAARLGKQDAATTEGLLGGDFTAGLSPSESIDARLSGGIYRDNAMLNTMMRYDRGRLQRELQGQAGEPSVGERAAAAPVYREGDTYTNEPLNHPDAQPYEPTGGSLSVVPRTPSRTDKLRQMRARDLLSVLGGMKGKEGAGAGKAATRAQHLFQEDERYTEMAGTEGVAAAIADIRARAARDPNFAVLAPKLMSGLHSRAVSHADKKSETFADPESGGLTSGYLPLDRQTISELARRFAGPGLEGPNAPPPGGLLERMFGGSAPAAPAPAAAGEPAPMTTPGDGTDPTAQSLTAPALSPDPRRTPHPGDADLMAFLAEVGLLQPGDVPAGDPLAARSRDARR